jgi:hypothetical protein
MTELELRKEAELRGYVHGCMIKSDHFTVELVIGFGLVWSEHQNSLVVGCTDKDNNYYSSVPIYNGNNNTWVQIVKQDHE